MKKTLKEKKKNEKDRRRQKSGRGCSSSSGVIKREENFFEGAWMSPLFGRFLIDGAALWAINNENKGRRRASRKDYERRRFSKSGAMTFLCRSIVSSRNCFVCGCVLLQANPIKRDLETSTP
ncbi:hypothetical protein CEXT_669371 [Caerostris extrusa]|uniref:Uncharacterized protein n=1 Tax=Caerostris extrusa TaxID=172846 RepID=A0AAV4NBS5_CAEEX|nr:hypothetical protein CEXT_669371 [Caerostris extrusa]